MPNVPFDNNIIKHNMDKRKVSIRKDSLTTCGFVEALDLVETLFKLTKQKFFKYDGMYFLIDYDKSYDSSRLGYEQELEHHTYTYNGSLEDSIRKFMGNVYLEWCDPDKYLIIIVKQILQCMEDDVDTKFIYSKFIIDKV